MLIFPTVIPQTKIHFRFSVSIFVTLTINPATLYPSCISLLSPPVCDQFSVLTTVPHTAPQRHLSLDSTRHLLASFCCSPLCRPASPRRPPPPLAAPPTPQDRPWRSRHPLGRNGSICLLNNL